MEACTRRIPLLLNPIPHIDRLLVEWIGTLILTFTIGMASAKPHPLTPLSIGSSLMCAIFMGGHISGGHFNPAVSLGVWLAGRGTLNYATFIHYIMTQIVGAIIGAGLAYSITEGDISYLTPQGTASLAQAFGAELLWTTFLVIVMLCVATSKAQANNSFFGLAIGFTVVSGAVAVGPISGGGFNPAVALGLGFVAEVTKSDIQVVKNLWVYVIAPSLGGAFAAGLFRVTNAAEYHNVASPTAV